MGLQRPTVYVIGSAASSFAVFMAWMAYPTSSLAGSHDMTPFLQWLLGTGLIPAFFTVLIQAEFFDAAPASSKPRTRAWRSFTACLLVGILSVPLGELSASVAGGFVRLALPPFALMTMARAADVEMVDPRRFLGFCALASIVPTLAFAAWSMADQYGTFTSVWMALTLGNSAWNTSALPFMVVVGSQGAFCLAGLWRLRRATRSGPTRPPS